MWSRAAVTVLSATLAASACATSPSTEKLAQADPHRANAASPLEVTPTSDARVFRARLGNNANLSTAALTQKFESLLRDHCDGPFTLLAEKVVVVSVHVLTPPQSLPAPEVTDVVRCGGTPEGIVVTLTSMNDPGLFEARLVESFGLPPNKWGAKFQSLLDEFCGGRATASDMLVIFSEDPPRSLYDFRPPLARGQTQFRCEA